MIKLTENFETLSNLVIDYRIETDIEQIKAIALIMSKVTIKTSWGV